MWVRSLDERLDINISDPKATIAPAVKKIAKPNRIIKSPAAASALSRFPKNNIMIAPHVAVAASAPSTTAVSSRCERR